MSIPIYTPTWMPVTIVSLSRADQPNYITWVEKKGVKISFSQALVRAKLWSSGSKRYADNAIAVPNHNTDAASKPAVIIQRDVRGPSELYQESCA